MTTSETLNLIAASAIVALIVLQLILLVVVAVVIVRIKNVVADMKRIAESGEELMRELGKQMKHQTSLVSILKFVVSKAIKHRKKKRE